MMRTTMAFALLLALMGCSGPAETPTPAADTAPADTAPAPDPVAVATETSPTTEEEKPMSEYDKVADIQTDLGTITVRFFPDKAPNHVRNFIDLAQQGFYDGIGFHRVIAGFMIQGGDPNTKTANRGSWGTGGSGKNVKAEFNDTPHRRGILSMARSGHPDSASSQFFIVVKDSSFLDNQYTAFGEVTSGMDVADKIVAAAKGQENPEAIVRIQKVTVRDADAS